MRDIQHARATGESITNVLSRHLNEKVPIDVISRESGLSSNDIEEFFELRGLMDELNPSLDYYDDGGTRYCIMQDDIHVIAPYLDADREATSVSGAKKADSLARSQKITNVTIGMKKADGILSAMAAAIFACMFVYKAFFLIFPLVLNIVNLETVGQASLSSIATELIIPGMAFGVMWSVDGKSSRSLLKKDVKTHYGFDTIIAGIVGCFAWGIGWIFILKGALLFMGEASTDDAARRPPSASLAFIVDGFNGSCWALPAFIGGAGMLSFASSLVLALVFQGALVPSWYDPWLPTVVLSLLGLVASRSYHKSAFPAVKRGEVKGLPNRVLGLSIINLACYGTGVPMLIQSVLLHVLDTMITRAEQARKKLARNEPGMEASSTSEPPALLRGQEAPFNPSEMFGEVPLGSGTSSDPGVDETARDTEGPGAKRKDEYYHDYFPRR